MQTVIIACLDMIIGSHNLFLWQPLRCAILQPTAAGPFYNSKTGTMPQAGLKPGSEEDGKLLL